MKVIHPDILGDLGDQMLAAELGSGIRRPVDDRPGHLQPKSTLIDSPESEYGSLAERIKELMEFMAF